MHSCKISRSEQKKPCNPRLNKQVVESFWFDHVAFLDRLIVLIYGYHLYFMGACFQL